MDELINKLRIAVDNAELVQIPEAFSDIRLLLNQLEDALAPTPFITDKHIQRQSHSQPLGEQVSLTHGDADLSLNDMPTEQQKEWFKGVKPIEL